MVRNNEQGVMQRNWIIVAEREESYPFRSVRGRALYRSTAYITPPSAVIPRPRPVRKRKVYRSSVPSIQSEMTNKEKAGNGKNRSATDHIFRLRATCSQSVPYGYPQSKRHQDRQPKEFEHMIRKVAEPLHKRNEILFCTQRKNHPVTEWSLRGGHER